MRSVYHPLNITHRIFTPRGTGHGQGGRETIHLTEFGVMTVTSLHHTTYRLFSHINSVVFWGVKMRGFEHLLAFMNSDYISHLESVDISSISCSHQQIKWHRSCVQICLFARVVSFCSLPVSEMLDSVSSRTSRTSSWQSYRCFDFRTFLQINPPCTATRLWWSIT